MSREGRCSSSDGARVPSPVGTRGTNLTRGHAPRGATNGFSRVQPRSRRGYSCPPTPDRGPRALA